VPDVVAMLGDDGVERLRQRIGIGRAAALEWCGGGASSSSQAFSEEALPLARSALRCRNTRP
jgi:hypothetical protein